MVSTIGIISGSGPEAGIDLWAKVVGARRRQLGESYRGDEDAPRVVVISEPTLGLSMDLETHRHEVWVALERTAIQLATQVDVYAIACNTLNVFADDLDALALPASLISVQGVTADYLTTHGIERVGLLGARPISGLGASSAYRKLAEMFQLVTPSDPDPLHQLIADIKRLGPRAPGLAETLAELVTSLDAEPVLLACTELPLVEIPSEVETVDVTELLATALVATAL